MTHPNLYSMISRYRYHYHIGVWADIRPEWRWEGGWRGGIKGRTRSNRLGGRERVICYDVGTYRTGGCRRRGEVHCILGYYWTAKIADPDLAFSILNTIFRTVKFASTASWRSWVTCRWSTRRKGFPRNVLQQSRNAATFSRSFRSVHFRFPFAFLFAIFFSSFFVTFRVTFRVSSA